MLFSGLFDPSRRHIRGKTVQNKGFCTNSYCEIQEIWHESIHTASKRDSGGCRDIRGFFRAIFAAVV